MALAGLGDIGVSGYPSEDYSRCGLLLRLGKFNIEGQRFITAHRLDGNGVSNAMFFHGGEKVLVGRYRLAIDCGDHVPQNNVAATDSARTNHARIIRWEPAVGSYDRHTLYPIALDPLIGRPLDT